MEQKCFRQIKPELVMGEVIEDIGLIDGVWHIKLKKSRQLIALAEGQIDDTGHSNTNK